MFGVKSTTAPTPPIIPSTMRERISSFGIVGEMVLPNHVKNSAIHSIGIFPMVKVN